MDQNFWTMDQKQLDALKNQITFLVCKISGQKVTNTPIKNLNTFSLAIKKGLVGFRRFLRTKTHFYARKKGFIFLKMHEMNQITYI